MPNTFDTTLKTDNLQSQLEQVKMLQKVVEMRARRKQELIAKIGEEQFAKDWKLNKLTQRVLAEEPRIAPGIKSASENVPEIKIVPEAKPADDFSFSNLGVESPINVTREELRKSYPSNETEPEIPNIIKRDTKIEEAELVQDDGDHGEKEPASSENKKFVNWLEKDWAKLSVWFRRGMQLGSISLAALIGNKMVHDYKHPVKTEIKKEAPAKKQTLENKSSVVVPEKKKDEIKKDPTETVTAIETKQEETKTAPEQKKTSETSIAPKTETPSTPKETVAAPHLEHQKKRHHETARARKDPEAVLDTPITKTTVETPKPETVEQYVSYRTDASPYSAGETMEREGEVLVDDEMNREIFKTAEGVFRKKMEAYYGPHGTLGFHEWKHVGGLQAGAVIKSLDTAEASANSNINAPLIKNILAIAEEYSLTPDEGETWRHFVKRVILTQQKGEIIESK